MSTQKPGNQRFSIIPARAVADTELSRSALAVLAALGIYGDREGWCWPSQSTLGDILGISRQAVGRHVKTLVKRGYLESKERRDPETDRQLTNKYRILFDAPPATSEVAPPATSEVALTPQENGKHPTDVGTPVKNSANEVTAHLVHAFFQPAGSDVPKQAWGRAGVLSKAVREYDTDVTPDKLNAFKAWYEEKYPKADLPLGEQTFMTHYGRFATDYKAEPSGAEWVLGGVEAPDYSADLKIKDWPTPEGADE